MKKLILLILLALFIQVKVSSQYCLPNGIQFHTQMEIDSFQSNYPNCTVIQGDVSISGWSITNLNGLNALTAIEGELEIMSNSLVNLSGLSSLSLIGGDLNIVHTQDL